jgi:hypothetical protein
MVTSQTSFSTAQKVRAKGWETSDNWPKMPQGQFVTTPANHGASKKVHHINMASYSGPYRQYRQRSFIDL